MWYKVVLNNHEGRHLVGLCDNLFDAECVAPEYECSGVVSIVKTASMAVWEGRHVIPKAVDGSVFTDRDSEYITDPEMLEEIALLKIRDMGVNYLDLYITGLTVAVLATINACKELGVKVVTWHYNRDTGDYYHYPIK